MKSNPLGIYKWDDKSFFNPYQNSHSWRSDWWQGESGGYLTNAWAAFVAAKALNRPKLRTLGYNLINFICRANPLGNTLTNKVGGSPPPRVYGLIGEDRGTIINGLVASADGRRDPKHLQGLELALGRCKFVHRPSYGATSRTSAILRVSQSLAVFPRESRKGLLAMGPGRNPLANE